MAAVQPQLATFTRRPGLLMLNAADIRPFILVGLCPLIAVVLASLFILLRRERVKEELRLKCFQPVSIQWRPFGPGWGYGYRTGFRVIYIDFHGYRHSAFCWVGGMNFIANIRWVRDEVIGREVSDEPA